MEMIELVRELRVKAHFLPDHDAIRRECRICGFAAHDRVLMWDAETFGVLRCDGVEVTRAGDRGRRGLLDISRQRLRHSAPPHA